MKILSTPFKDNIIGKKVYTHAMCWKIVLQDGFKLGFTTHTRNVVFDEEPDLIYKTKDGIIPTSTSTDSNFSVDNMDVQAIFDDDAIKESDLLQGRYDFADVYVFNFDWSIKPYLLADTEPLIHGKLGEIRSSKNKFNAELRSLLQYLQLNICDLYQPTCRAKFADAKCKLDILDHTFEDVVATVTSPYEFTVTTTAEADGEFNYGYVLWVTGENAGVKQDVKTWDQATKTIKLQLPMYRDIVVGDEVKLIRGCNKTRERCKGFNNIINFRGEPFIPGVDAMTGGSL